MDSDNHPTERRRGKKLCVSCKSRPAKFRPRGRRYKSDARHDMCNQCWRAEIDRWRAMNTHICN